MLPNAYGELDELDVTEPMSRVAAPSFTEDWRPMYRAIESEVVPMSASRAADGTRPRPSRPSLPPPKRPSTASIPAPMAIRPSGPVAAAPQYIDNYGSDRIAMRRAPRSRGRNVLLGGALVVGVLGVIAGLTYATAHTNDSAAPVVRVEQAPDPAAAPAAAPAVAAAPAPAPVAVAAAPAPAAVAVAPKPAAVAAAPKPAAVAAAPKPVAVAPKPATPAQPAIAPAPVAAPQPAVARAAPAAPQPHPAAPTRVAAAPAPAAKPSAQAAAIAANEGALKISTTVPCEIYVDGKATHKVTPQRSLRLAAGSHSLLLVNDVARVHKEVTVSITAGYSTVIDVATP